MAAGNQLTHQIDQEILRTKVPRVLNGRDILELLKNRLADTALGGLPLREPGFEKYFRRCCRR